MTIDNNSQRFNSYQKYNLENQQDVTDNSKHRLKTKLLAFGDSTNLLDDILNHPLSIDYFNVYLSLPIFGQRVFYHRTTHQFDFDPPLLSKTCERIYDETKEWLINCRLNNYIHTDIYIENLLGLLLTKIESSSKEIITEEQSSIFSTVTDIRQFHQFLQSTSGIKYWNFFIDSMRLLQSRHSLRSNRIDISYLNFIYKYYSQQHEFHSITIDLDHPLMPDSSTSDEIWFQMAINAMHQLRVYWIPRYLGQVSPSLRSKIKYTIIESQPKQINNVIKSTSENTIETSSNHIFSTNSIIKEPNLVKYTLGNISYLDYNPQQYIPIQPSVQHDFQQDMEELNESEINNDTNQIDKDSSDRSIEEYATDANMELFYRILVSDSLAGLPFFEYISQIISKTDIIPYQTCIHFITDAEILLSIPSGKFKERILRQFITRYLEVTATEKLPNQIIDHIEKERNDLINELIENDNNQYILIWKILLEITKFLIPHFLNYIKFDRLRFLLQGKPLNKCPIFDDLHRRLPLVNFEILLTDQQNPKEIDLKQINSNLINCGEQQTDLLKSLFKNQYDTTEKLINTDEQCEFRQGERFPPLTDNEIEQELRQFCTKFEWNDIKTVLGKSFNVSTIDNKTLLISNEDSKLNLIETFTLNIMNSGREIFEIDRFISNLMDESLNIFQEKSSLDSLKSDLNSSPLSPIFEEILLTDSSSITSQKLITNNTNNNALISPDSETKILSIIGSYFINPPSIKRSMDNLPSQSILSSEFNNKSSTINIKQISKQDNFFYEPIKFAQKDASNDVKNILIDKQISSFQNDDQQQLLKFTLNHINNNQWPLQEYIGLKGHLAWRALKLAADISNLDSGLMLDYHNNLDWMSIDENFGSFGERTYLILRDFHRRIEQQKRSIIKKDY